MPNDSMTLRQAVVLGYLGEEELRVALERAGDPSQALAELVTSGRLSPSQVERAKVVSDAGQKTQQAPAAATVVLKSDVRVAPEDPGMIGRVIGGCRIEAAIGAGGMGAVYRARHLGLDKTVAVKILPPHFAQSQEMVDRFQREARAVAKIDHPNIVGVLNVGVEGGLHFIVMPVVDGRSLTDRLGRGPIPPDEAVRLARGVADGLAEAHRNGIVHRDVKPDNILLSGSAGAKLIDFGLARDGAPSGLTEAGQLLGTPHYMSPEQCRGEAADARSDVYALGATLYHALTGRLPHEAKSLYELLDSIVKTRPRPPHEVNPAIPQNLSMFVLWMMEPDRDRRPASMEEVSRGLAAIERGSVVAVPARSAPSRGSRRLTILAVVLVALIFIFWRTVGRTLRHQAVRPDVPAPRDGENPTPPRPAKAHQPPGIPTSSFKVFVLPEGSVVTLDNDYVTLTQTSGNAWITFTDVAVGRATLRIEHPGYETVEEMVNIAPKFVAERRVVLRKSR